VAGLIGALPLLSPHDAALAMTIGALHVALGMILYTLGSTVIPAAELTLLSMLEVLFAPVWVWLFLGETATAGTFIGGAVLMGAVAFNGLSGAWSAVAARGPASAAKS
jgi:drug/metabolite transporter (DMT)-like permease